MNLVLLARGDLEPGGRRARLIGRRLEYVREIHRAKVGDPLCVGLEGGRIGRGEILRIDDEALEIDVVLDRDPPPPAPLELVIAMPRPLVLGRVLIAATTLGIKKIHLIAAARVEKSYWQSHSLSPAAIGAQLRLGLEQAVDTILPEVVQHRRFRPFAEDRLPELLEGRCGVLADPGLARSDEPPEQGGFVGLIGPEGGWNEFERERLLGAGCRPLLLGPRILRVETAVACLATRLLAP